MREGEHETWEGILPCMMSEEEGDDDDENVFVVRSPTWRSDAFRRLLAVLDKRDFCARAKLARPQHRVQRRKGQPGQSIPPAHTPQWAMSVQAQEKHRNEVSTAICYFVTCILYAPL